MPSFTGSNNTNKLSPQERRVKASNDMGSSNNTNKLSPQELPSDEEIYDARSNNTNKLSPQELPSFAAEQLCVQIIQINLALKNEELSFHNTSLFK